MMHKTSMRIKGATPTAIRKALPVTLPKDTQLITSTHGDFQAIVFPTSIMVIVKSACKTASKFNTDRITARPFWRGEVRLHIKCSVRESQAFLKALQ